MRKRAVATLLALALLAIGTGAGAITYGEPDGNGHPYVGALIWQRPSDGAFRILCSGTLIDEDLFLTAAHCTAFLESQNVSGVWVSFDSGIPNAQTANRIAATYLTHPAFNPNTLRNDVALVFLAASPGLAPAAIIGENGLSTMKSAGTLRGQSFTAVGYGRTSEWQFGPPVQSSDGTRRFSTSPYLGLTQNNLLLLMTHNATGAGGTCSGDSGGPHFVGNTNVIASVTSWGDALCRSLDQTQRVDVPSVHDFIELYLD
jgi:secreted trypsin-like serine protease